MLPPLTVAAGFGWAEGPVTACLRKALVMDVLSQPSSHNGGPPKCFSLTGGSRWR